MIISFRINYKTSYGQALYVCGNCPELGNGDETDAMPMQCYGDSDWRLSVPIAKADKLAYYYLIKGSEDKIREWGSHHVEFGIVDELNITDYWQNKPGQSYLYTSAFTESFFKHTKNKTKAQTSRNAILLNVSCPYVQKGQTLVLCGEDEYMGAWKEAKALVFDYKGDACWQLLIPADKIKESSEYKLAVADEKTKRILHWETGNNRIWHPIKTTTDRKTTECFSLDVNFERLNWKAAGVAIPVFSLRSEQSSGIGEFPDLKLMVDWAVVTGQKVIQVLPINDTTTTHTWRDSYPYSAVSIYALHPLYLGLKEHPLKDILLQEEFDQKAKALNAQKKMDYDAVSALKNNYFQQLFKEKGKETLNGNGFQAFFNANEHWLFPYACFCVLRDLNGTADSSNWKEHTRYDKKTLEKFVADNQSVKNTVVQIYFIQYLLHIQLSDVVNYAHEKGVILKGDIPIGISRCSVEAWTEPHLFNLDVQTGAPPDDFSVNGQNWGFPTYNWEAMEKDGYEWWKNRFRKMADYFDAYRIDHILGFFRIWEIPMHSVQGLLGYFSPALPFSLDEIRNAGLWLNENRMTKPYIHECYLHELFGEYTPEVIAEYLNVIAWQQFELKEFCNTQRKIQTLFNGKRDDKSRCVRDGLFSLCNELLFVRDKKEPYKLHPRISAQHTCSYRSLNDGEKEVYNRLYEHFFYRRHNDFWKNQAMCKLPELISSTKMLVCGEDLGMIPDCVPSVMKELQILSLEIERMPKTYNMFFENLSEIPYLSVCTTSTHDMSPIRIWWKESREITQQYYNEVLSKSGTAPENCTPELCEQIIKNHLNSPAMLTIIPLQDWLSISAELRSSDPEEERINVPANPEHYWHYRMHLTLEKLLAASKYNRSLLTLLKETDRESRCLTRTRM